MSAEGQIDLLADYIMAEVDGEPSQSEGAGDCAVRLLTKYRKAIRGAMNELGVRPRLSCSCSRSLSDS